ncbi:hypothetical protein M436DRAFT_14732, partial [Aureobasidium namibiae CBS 147.97]
MAITRVDRKVLAHLINYYVSDNRIVVETLRTVLGLSVMLEQKLSQARRLRQFDKIREARSLDLYQQILFLAKEGLALTEVHIAPHCGENAEGIYQVMALKLRASFHHIFCLYHNTPPVRLLRPNEKKELSIFSINYMANRKSQEFNLTPPVLAHEPDKVSPKITLQSHAAPTRPPGLGMNATNFYEPPVPASTFLMPPLDYTPETKRLFERAAKFAENFLHPAHPLVLSLALERATFLIDCLSDYEKSLKVVKKAARAA